MVNTTKIKNLAKEKGIKIGYICEQLGVNHTYIANVANGKNTMSDDRIYTVAKILGTTYEYLTDQTDDPFPNDLSALSPRDRLVLLIGEKVMDISEEEVETLVKVFSQPDDAFSKILAVLSAMI